MLVIGLDAGHGGIDAGATGNGYKEKDLTLELTLKVAAALRRHGARVVLTRTTDKYLSLADRVNIANNAGVDSFTSIHFNSAASNKAQGVETFSHTGSARGKKQARSIQDNITIKKIHLADRGIKSAQFYVIRKTSMSAALVEVAFINNYQDIQNYRKHINAYAEAIAAGILEYNGYKYIPEKPEIEKPAKPQITPAKDKVNLLLLSEHIAINGFKRDDKNYIEIDGSYHHITKILEGLGLTVNWNNNLKIVTADINKEFRPGKENIDILLLGSKITVNSIKYKDRNCIKYEDVYIPIRSIFEAMGLKVEWNRKNNMILVNK